MQISFYYMMGIEPPTKGSEIQGKVVGVILYFWRDSSMTQVAQLKNLVLQFQSSNYFDINSIRGIPATFNQHYNLSQTTWCNPLNTFLLHGSNWREPFYPLAHKSFNLVNEFKRLGIWMFVTSITLFVQCYVWYKVN